jgi:hypothetical protein
MTSPAAETSVSAISRGSRVRQATGASAARRACGTPMPHHPSMSRTNAAWASVDIIVR